jgi:hypothetical protein
MVTPCPGHRDDGGGNGFAGLVGNAAGELRSEVDMEAGEMNRDITTSFPRMVCAVGHTLEWRGRWLHKIQTIEPVAPDAFTGNVAEYPRSYYKVGANDKT